MRLAIGFNPVLPVRDAVALAKKIEAEGYESLWFHESLYQRDVVSYLSSIALSTSSLKMASGGMNTFTRHPAEIAATFSTLSELSEGRVMAGLCLGSFPTIPKIGERIFPVKETRPLKRMTECVEIVRRLMAGENVNFDGQFFKISNLQLDPKSKFKVPIYLAGLSRRMVENAGGVGDGVILSAGLATVEMTAEMVAWAKKGDRQSKADRVSYIFVSLDPDREKARNAIRQFYFFQYMLAEVIKVEDIVRSGVKMESVVAFRDAWKKDKQEALKILPEDAMDALAICGTADEAVEKISRYRKAGVDLPILMPIGNVPYAVEQLGKSGGRTA